MDCDRLFSQDTVKLLMTLMTFERAHAVAIACFQQSTVAMSERQGQEADWKEDVFFVSAETEGETYLSFLRRNWSEYGERKATRENRPPWLIFAEIVGACSDLGGWYIYGEKFSEIALLGFADNPGAFLERKLLSEFGIEKLAHALQRDTFFGKPGDEHSKSQRSILRSAYLASSPD